MYVIFGRGLRASGEIQCFGIRRLRTDRSTRAGQRRVLKELIEKKRAEEEQLAAKKAARKIARLERPLPTVGNFIRVRDFAKALKQPLESVLKHVAIRRNRRLHMRIGSDQFIFKNIKEVILPFDFAEDVARKFNTKLRFDDIEPQFLSTASISKGVETIQRNPVIAVMGHVDHGKTTLMDTLRGSKIAQQEAHGITQKVNICETELLPHTLHATFLDTPGHFHFFRMRTNAAHVADLVVLVIAGDEGCLLQTDESVGAIEEAGLPVIACINKVDVTTPEQIETVRQEIRSFVALETCPIIEISGKTGANLDTLKQTIATMVGTPSMQRKLKALMGPREKIPAQGIVLESIVMKGKGTMLRILVKAGLLVKGDHFVAGMIHGVVRSVRHPESNVEIIQAVPGTVVDVMFSNKSKIVDAPIEYGFFVLPEHRAKQVIEQRQLALALGESRMIPDIVQNDINELIETSEDEMNEQEHEVVRKPIIVKADSAGSITSIQDTVDEFTGIRTVRMGLGHITTLDIDVAINAECPIFGYNVKLGPREAKLARDRGIRVFLCTTIHGLIHEIEQFQQQSIKGV